MQATEGIRALHVDENFSFVGSAYMASSFSSASLTVSGRVVLLCHGPRPHSGLLCYHPREDRRPFSLDSELDGLQVHRARGVCRRRFVQLATGVDGLGFYIGVEVAVTMLITKTSIGVTHSVIKIANLGSARRVPGKRPASLALAVHFLEPSFRLSGSWGHHMLVSCVFREVSAKVVHADTLPGLREDTRHRKFSSASIGRQGLSSSVTWRRKRNVPLSMWRAMVSIHSKSSKRRHGHPIVMSSPHYDACDICSHYNKLLL